MIGIAKCRATTARASEVAVFIAGCENSDSQYEFSAWRRRRLAAFLVAGCLFSRRRTIGPEITFVSNELTMGIMGGNPEYIHHGPAIKRIADFWRYATVFSSRGLPGRLAIVLSALAHYPSEARRYGLSRWIEFRFFSETFSSARMKSERLDIKTASLSDRYVTWMSGLIKPNNDTLEIRQHGTLLAFRGLPNKIWVSRFGVYNEAEEAAARRTVVGNPDCEYFTFPFISHVSFTHYPKQQGVPLVGVVSQFDVQFNRDVIQTVTDCLSQSQVVLMLHPHERLGESYQKMLSDFPNLTVEANKKYSNFDVLITTNSTMVYDYFYAGLSPKILLVSEKHVFEFLSANVVYVDSIQALRGALL